MAKALQKVNKTHDDFKKQEAPKRKKAAKKFESQRKAEWQKKAKDAKFLRSLRQLIKKRAEAKTKGKVNNHTRLYIRQLRTQLQEAEDAYAQRELKLLLCPQEQRILIPTQACTVQQPTCTTAPATVTEHALSVVKPQSDSVTTGGHVPHSENVISGHRQHAQIAILRQQADSRVQTEQVKCAALQRQLSTTTAEMDRLVEHQKRVREMHDAAYQDAAIAKKLYAENIRLELKEMRDRLFDSEEKNDALKEEVEELEEMNDALEEQFEEFSETFEELQNLNDCQNRMIAAYEAVNPGYITLMQGHRIPKAQVLIGHSRRGDADVGVELD